MTTLWDDIKAGSGQVAAWIERNKTKYEGIVGQVPTLLALIEDGAAEIVSADDPETKALEIFKDIGKAAHLISALMQANADPNAAPPVVEKSKDPEPAEKASVDEGDK